ncbi:MAG: SGNH/GDSL hydrolase family protein [Acidobacteria bacterium]|nr:SGNH/GDSL hydrolase family protein [Acidobacteriota bacterium]
MSVTRKLFYSLLTLSLFFLAIEGTARVLWRRLEARAFEERRERGAAVLRNDAVNYLREPSGIYGYALRPHAQAGAVYINGQGFHQRDEIPLARRPGFLRVICLGESTTFGSSVDNNYPAYLRRILESNGRGFTGYEVINAGVPGWVSDQIALRAEHELAAYKPDAVILYVGWNDFQSYNPLAAPPAVSYFEHAYGGSKWKQYAASWLKSVALLSALYHSRRPDPELSPGYTPGSGGNPPEKCYRFLLASLDQIAASFRLANPNVKIFVCTLVGRWPHGPPEEWAHIPPVWWMKQGNIGPGQAAEFVRRLNDRLRAFARSRGLPLIDLAAAFENLDRSRLLWDWAHMYEDGYELMAWNLSSAMRKAGVVQGEPSPREAELIAKYQH